jgi:hypothetical protein
MHSVNSVNGNWLLLIVRVVHPLWTQCVGTVQSYWMSMQVVHVRKYTIAVQACSGTITNCCSLRYLKETKKLPSYDDTCLEIQTSLQIKGYFILPHFPSAVEFVLCCRSDTVLTHDNCTISLRLRCIWSISWRALRRRELISDKTHIQLS